MSEVFDLDITAGSFVHTMALEKVVRRHVHPYDLNASEVLLLSIPPCAHRALTCIYNFWGCSTLTRRLRPVWV